MNQKELKELIEFLIEKDITEFELERGDVKVRIKRGRARGRGTAPDTATLRCTRRRLRLRARHASSASPRRPFRALGAPPAPEEGLHMVRSPIVGTFYESPSPGRRRS